MSAFRTATLIAATFAVPALAQTPAPAAKPAPAAAPAAAPAKAAAPASAKPTLRERIKTEKKAIVEMNIAFTEDEGKKFWPVYEAYQADLAKLNERQVAVIQEFAKNYEAMDDKTAKKLLTEHVAVETDRAKLHSSYLPKFRKAVPEKKVARYYQIENKLRAVVNVELADAIPLME